MLLLLLRLVSGTAKDKLELVLECLEFGTKRLIAPQDILAFAFKAPREWLDLPLSADAEVENAQGAHVTARWDSFTMPSMICDEFALQLLTLLDGAAKGYLTRKQFYECVSKELVILECLLESHLPIGELGLGPWELSCTTSRPS